MRKILFVGLVLGLVLAASVAWADQFVGTWTATQQDEQWQVRFNADGTFTRQVTKGGQVHNEQGQYQIQGNRMFVKVQGESEGYYLQFRFANNNTLDLYEDGKFLARMIRQTGGGRQVDRNQVQQLFKTGLGYYDKKQYEQALPYFKKMMQLDPSDRRGYWYAGRCQTKLNRHEDAIATFTQAIKRFPKVAIFYFARAHNFYNIKKLKWALADVEQAVDLKPQDQDFLRMRENLRRKLAAQGSGGGQQGSSGQGTGATAAVSPDQAAEAKKYSAQGWAFLKQNQWDRAAANFTKAIKLDPNNAGAYAGRGYAFRRLRFFGRSIDDYSKAIQLRPDIAIGYYSRALAYRESGDLRRALADVETYLQKKPGDKSGIKLRDEIKRALAGGQGSSTQTTSSSGDPAAQAKAHFSQGSQLYKQGKYAQAIAAFNQAIKLNPKYALAYFNRGLAYRRSNRLDEAIADYSKVLELMPNAPIVYYNRAIAFALKGQHYNALADVDRYIQLKPDDPDGRKLKQQIQERMRRSGGS